MRGEPVGQDHRPQLLHERLTHRIIGAGRRVYDVLGVGHLEAPYANAFCVELTRNGIAIEREVPFDLMYEGVLVGRYRADIVCDRKVLIEVKAGDKLPPSAFAQTLNYLRVTRLEVGLIFHFGPRFSFQRLVLDSARRPAPRMSAPCQRKSAVDDRPG